MKITTNKPTLIPKMYCQIFGHDFEVTKNVTYHVKEYTCSHCKKQLTTNSNGSLIELTPKFKEINARCSSNNINNWFFHPTHLTYTLP